MDHHYHRRTSSLPPEGSVTRLVGKEKYLVPVNARLVFGQLNDVLYDKKCPSSVELG